MEAPPTIAVILIHHRMQDHLRQCIFSIRQNSAANQICVIIAHLKTPEDDGAWIQQEFPEVKLVFVESFGIALMRNRALREARTPYVFILDADARLQAGALEGLLAFMKDHPKAAAAGPRTLRPDGTQEANGKRFYTWLTIAVRRSPLDRRWPNNYWTRRHLMQDRDWTQPFECDWIAGAGMFLRREALEQVGLFDERFVFGFEDVDWCFRAKEKNWQVWFTPSASIVHYIQRRSAKGFNRATIEHLRSLWRFWRKHHRLSL